MTHTHTQLTCKILNLKAKLAFPRESHFEQEKTKAIRERRTYIYNTHTHKWHANFLKQDAKLAYLCESHFYNNKKTPQPKEKRSTYTYNTQTQTHSIDMPTFLLKKRIRIYMTNLFQTRTQINTTTKREPSKHTRTHNWHATFFEARS